MKTNLSNLVIKVYFTQKYKDKQYLTINLLKKYFKAKQSYSYSNIVKNIKSI